MLTAGFFQAGPLRNITSVLAGIFATLTLVKFFLVTIEPNHMGYRHRNEKPLYTRKGYWAFSWRTGFMYFMQARHMRVYKKGVKFKVPYLWDIRVVSIADETRHIGTVKAHGPDGLQYETSAWITYRVIPEGWALFASLQRSQNVDESIGAAVRSAYGKVLANHVSLAFTDDGLTKAVRKRCRKRLKRYGIELICIETNPAALTDAQVLALGQATPAVATTVQPGSISLAS